MSWFEQIAAEPAALEFLALLLVGLIVWVVLRRLVSRVADAENRALLKDFLLGVEQVEHADYRSGVRRLEQVVESDPENVSARLLLAEARAQLGDHAAAHRHHVELQKAFGTQSWRNEVGLAAALIATGRGVDAVEPARRAEALAPDRLEVLRVLFEALECSAELDDAAKAGRRLLARLPAGERDLWSERVGRAFAAAAAARLNSGDVAATKKVLRRAGNLSIESPELLAVEARMLATTAGEEAAVRLLEAPGSGAVTQAAHFEETDHAMVLQRLSSGGPEAELFGELPSASRMADAIEANRAHVQRLCALWAAGDEESRDELVEIGPEAVEEVLLRALQNGAGDDAFPEVLRRMGPDCLQPLFDCWHRRRDDWRQRFGEWLSRGTPAAVLGRVVQGYGSEARAWFDELDDGGDRDLRKVRIDYYIGLAQPAECEAVLGSFPPVEVVHRLNDAEPDVVRRFIVALEPGSFFLDVLLADPSFERDAVLIDAVPDARAAESLIEVLTERGFSRTASSALIERLADGRLGAVASRVLESWGERAVAALAGAFADLDRSAAQRAAIADHLVAVQADVGGALCECFGSAPTPLDDDLVNLLVRLGDGAVADLRAAYQRGGVLERFGLGRGRRRRHRRETLVQALAGIGSARALEVLRELRVVETDSNLKLRIAQALHRLDRPSEEGEADERAG